MPARTAAAEAPVVRRNPRAIPLTAAALALLLLVVLGGLAGGVARTPSLSGLEQAAPSADALADIPADYLVLYQRAAAAYGVDWAVLAAIGKIECDHGRSQAAGCNPPGTVNAKGATGPMQFLGPTWRAGTRLGAVPPVGRPTASTAQGYASDGDGDGLADVWDPADAVFAAARLLAANGAPADYRAALYAYNPSPAYVDAVLAQAAQYRGALGTGGVAAALAWAVTHVGRYSYNLGPPTVRGGSVQQMQGSEPAGSTCDCSMYVRWAYAQAGIDAGLTTATQWTANGLFPNDNAPAQTPQVSRGVGAGPPPGGYQPGDIIFFGHDAGPSGHDALWFGNGQIVQCSAGGNGSNIRPLDGYVTPTGWVRWNLTAGG